MSKLALLFPGQGSQHIRMGQDLCGAFSEADKIFEKAGEILGFDLKKLCFEGDSKELTKTENAQPAILTLSYALYRVYTEELGRLHSAAAGHSLGEYSALLCAGVLSFEDALKLVRSRGMFMQEAAAHNPGTMAAVIGLDSGIIEQEIGSIDRTGESLVIANYNSRTQCVISGTTSCVGEASERLTGLGARVVPLKVSGAFHSPLMREAAQRLEEELERITFNPPGFDIISNVTAKPCLETGEIKDLLVKQITGSVLWHQTMSCLESKGIDTAIELGPKTVLRGLAESDGRNIKIYSANTEEDLSDLYELDEDNFETKKVNFLEECMGIAMGTRNSNWDQREYEEGVLKPYRTLKERYYELEEKMGLPGKKDTVMALELLKKILDTKKVPGDKQVELLTNLVTITNTSHMFNGQYSSPKES